MNKLIIFGIIFIVSGLMFFYHFFNIMISSLSKGDETFIDIFPGMITHVLPEMWHFHIPGFVLIGIGIYILIKYSRNDSVKITN